tara:strand:- start:613 stop:804 length:192 start_codon:yes stop_codon:yes gene_type:complete
LDTWRSCWLLLLASSETEIKAAKERDPLWIDGSGIDYVLLIESVNVVGVGAVQIGWTHRNQTR